MSSYLSSFRDKFYYGHFPSLPKLALNLSLLFNLVPGQQEGIVWTSWTIGVEILFYLAFIPIYRMQIWLQGAIAVAAFIVFTVGSVYAPNYFYWSVLGFFPIFIFGMLAFAAHELLKMNANRRAIGLTLIVVGLITLTACAAAGGGEKEVDSAIPLASDTAFSFWDASFAIRRS